MDTFGFNHPIHKEAKEKGRAICDGFTIDMSDQKVLFPELGHPPEPAKGFGSRTGKKKTGYAASPGTGPDGETCGTCEFKTKKPGVAGNYLKCKLMVEAWTGGKGSDIKSRSPACRLWEKKLK